MEANGHNFVLTIRDSYLGDRDTLIIAEREPNGDTRELMGEGPVRSEDLPLVGMRVSTHPTVVFALLPGGAQDIEAVATDGSKPTVSTTRISAPRGGAEFVAVAFGLAAAETDVANLTWTDPQGQRHNWPR